MVAGVRAIRKEEARGKSRKFIDRAPAVPVETRVCTRVYTCRARALLARLLPRRPLPPRRPARSGTRLR